MKKLDMIIIILVVIVAAGFGAIKFVFPNNEYDSKYVEIMVKGKLYKKVDLSEDGVEEIINIKTELGENTVKIKNGGVSIIEADCPDELCIKSGVIYEPGEIIVCLPHKVVIEIKGEKEEIDVKSY